LTGVRSPSEDAVVTILKEDNMGRWTAERWAAASGIAFVAAIVVSILLPGESPPDYNDKASSIVSFLNGNHTALAWSALFSGLAIVFFLWFLGSLAATLRDAHQWRLASVAYAGGLITAALGIAGDTLGLANMRLAGSGGSPDVVRGLWELQAFVYQRFAWPIIVLAGATTLAAYRSGAFPRWYAALGAIGVVLFALFAISVKTTGFFSPAGAMPWIGFLAFLVWTLVTSFLLVQKAAPAAMPAAAAQPM